MEMVSALSIRILRCTQFRRTLLRFHTNASISYWTKIYSVHFLNAKSNAFFNYFNYLINLNIFKENEENSSDNEEDVSEDITAIRFVPDDKTLLNPLFLAMNDCQALYPDESMSGDDEEDEEGEEDEEEGAELVHEYDESGFIDANTDPNDIQLSARGQEILRRLNINYQEHGNSRLTLNMSLLI